MPSHARRRRIAARSPWVGARKPTQRAVTDPLLELQSSAGNRAVVGAIQRKQSQEGQLLLSYEKMNEVFSAFLVHYTRGIGRHPTKEVWNRALARTRHQVGPGNWKRWKAFGLPKWGPPVTAEELDRKEVEKEVQAGLEAHYVAERKLVTTLQASANRLSRDVARVEHLADRLKSPDGIKGVVADYLGGFLGAASAIGTGIKDTKDEIEKFTKPITDTGGWLTDQAVDAAAKKPSGPTAEQKLKKLTTNLETADQLMRGELHLIWKATRPSYKSFQAARSRFDAGSKAWVRARDDVEAGNAVGEMRDGLTAMAKAARSLYDVCARYELMTKAANLAALDKAIEEGISLAVSTAVDLMAKELTKGIDNAAKDKLKQQVRPGLEKATEVAYDKIKGAPKKAAEIATQ